MQGQYKVNYDAAVFTKSREVGFCVIICDGAGSIVAKKRIGLTGAVEAEAKAMEVVVQFVKDVGIREATFEGTLSKLSIRSDSTTASGKPTKQLTL
ncbi:hypothetical protein CFP56_032571 [Quercus suber]|uniref:RNase H type-1 domain-containing protein n=1 Tax=Quercus suber TaxID=58331 RepID=A0AAW0LRQ5_QUESU